MKPEVSKRDTQRAKRRGGEDEKGSWDEEGFVEQGTRARLGNTNVVASRKTILRVLMLSA